MALVVALSFVDWSPRARRVIEAIFNSSDTFDKDGASAIDLMTSIQQMQQYHMNKLDSSLDCLVGADISQRIMDCYRISEICLIGV